MISVAIGLVFMSASVWGLINWRSDVLAALRGILPFIALGGGALTVLAGISGIRDRMLDVEKEKSPPARKN
ncbi:MAG: hypothetical protein QME32_03720 [Endomicrobiia bacterium]|nr:hypothetical protein [Endomicrobiia bacterium]